MKPVSVIIPVGPNESGWPEFVAQLELPKSSEILICCESKQLPQNLPAVPNGVDISACTGKPGRAGLMNAGALCAKNEWLWFLHFDSQLMDDTLEAMQRTVAEAAPGLYFFDLKFADDGPWAMVFNELAVRVRAGWLKIPFGDQGFLVHKELFEQLGGYREDLPYGEDHVFVWMVRQQGYPVRRAGAGLMTSARKYRQGGWASVTGLHVWLTIRQALPNWLLLQRRRIERLLK